MADKPKSLFQKAVDALTNKDENAAAAKAAADKAAADKAAADKAALAAKAKATADKAAADKAAADKLASAQKVAEEANMRKAMEAKAAMAAAPKEGVVTTRSLHIRKDHDANSAEVGGLVKDQKVTWTETWTDGKNTWVKLGDGQWAAMTYKGETYIKAK